MTTSNSKSIPFPQRFSVAYVVFMIISLIMLRSTKALRAASGMEKPQFGFSAYDSDSFEALACYLVQFSGYRWFFIADMFYMSSICWMVYTIFKKIKPQDESEEDYKWYKNLLLVFGSLSILVDCIENTCYLTGYYITSSFAQIKIGIIAIFLLVFLIYVIVRYYEDYIGEVRKFIRSSYISIILLVLIAFGLTLLPQGATLIVHLLEGGSWWSLASIAFSVFFVNMLAIMISHYPKYIEFRHYPPKKKKITWHMSRQLAGMGIITYDLKEKADPVIVLWGRYVLGILTYVAWLYIMYKAFALYGLTWFDPFPMTVLSTGLYLVFASYYYYKFDVDKKVFYERLLSDNFVDEDLNAMRSWVKVYVFWIFSTILFGLICMAVYYYLGWHKVSFIMSLFFIFCNATCFLLFRFTRSLLIYTCGDVDQIVKLRTLDYRSEGSLDWHRDKFSTTKPWSYFLKGSLWNFFVGFSSNLVFLKRLQFGGIVTLLFLLFANISLMMGTVTKISSIPIFLAFLVNVYAIIILYVKHRIFYDLKQKAKYVMHQKTSFWSHFEYKGEEVRTRYRRKYSRILTWTPLVLIIVVSILNGFHNFHKMDFTTSGNAFNVDKYSIHLDTHMMDNGIERLAKVASFGGGLKSNLWNLLVLDKLDSSMSAINSNRTFLDYCFSFSGVSGGAVGLGNYLVLDHNVRNHGLDKSKAIEAIGRENILSIDMAGLFAHDMLKNTFTLWNNERNKDRSYYAMEQYIKILSNQDTSVRCKFSESSQKKIWRDMYDNRGHIPALIINTASTGPYPGVAFSLQSKQGQHDPLKDEVFPGYILLENDEADLRYYDAVSTSNRFPIMSPTAQVENKGYFLDGGYFENSGLLTSSYFQNYLRNKSSDLANTPIMTINIINSKTDYIRKFIKDGVDQDKVVLKSSSNISSIISGITDINKLPNVLREAEASYQDDIDQIRSIYLPHLISTSDIEAIYGGQVVFNDSILIAIKHNNDNVRNALEAYITVNDLPIGISTHGIVEPPLARTLSDYAVIYQQAMISHFDDTTDEINDIVNWLALKKDKVLKK